MPRINADECICCGSCANQCAEDAIHEGDNSYVINNSKCTHCGACASACPVGAIH